MSELKKQQTSPEAPDRYTIPVDYYIMACISALFAAAAFILDSPERVFQGLYNIHSSRSVLITDYVALGGIGATLVNSAILSVFNLYLLVKTKTKPNGRIIASLFLTAGFSLFGKNMFNTIPILIGVWLHGKIYKKDLSDLIVWAIVGTTISPIVSQIAFIDNDTNLIKIIVAYAVGIFVGFIFPKVKQGVELVHRNFCLYKGGIAGGFIATLCAGILRSLGIEILPEEDYWDISHTYHLASIAFTIAFALIIYGIVKDTPKTAFHKLKQLTMEADQDNCDYLCKYGSSAYINIGIMCVLSTCLMLFLGIPINGPVLGGILTISGFACAGKHLRNTIPILIGSIVAAKYFNFKDVTTPLNCLAILFSTGLAPIAGRYGWLWGIIAGFVHVSIAIFIGDINGGLNLYNNGFAGCFVVIILLPIIMTVGRPLTKRKKKL